MAWIKKHCEDCKDLLGEEFEHVHKFLDQYTEVFHVAIFTEYHRSFLHNQAGLAAIASRWGQKASIAGVIHISRDYHEDLMDGKDLEWVLRNWGKVALYFSNMENFDPQISPDIIKGWKGESLCSIAFEKGGYDQYYQHLKEV